MVGNEDAIIFMAAASLAFHRWAGVWPLIFAGIDVGLRDGNTGEMVLPEPRIEMPDHAITVSDPVRTVRGEFGDGDALIAHDERGCAKLRKTRSSTRWVILGLCYNSKAHNWLSRVNEVRVRA